MNLIDKYIKDLNEKTRQDRAGALHPSNLGKCQRAAIYEFLGEEPTVEHGIETLRAFTMGNLIEELVTKAHDAEGVLIASQVPLGAEVDGVPVRGTLDELLKWEDGYAISDVKSVHANAFRYGKFPYAHHELQLGAYEWMLEEMTSMLYTVGLIRAIGQDNLGPRKPSVIYYLSYVSTYELKMKKVRVSKIAKEMAISELMELAGYVDRNEIPERPFKTPKEHNWLCMRKTPEGRVPGCLYYFTCWSNA